MPCYINFIEITYHRAIKGLILNAKHTIILVLALTITITNPHAAPVEAIQKIESIGNRFLAITKEKANTIATDTIEAITGNDIVVMIAEDADNTTKTITNGFRKVTQRIEEASQKATTFVTDTSRKAAEAVYNSDIAELAGDIKSDIEDALNKVSRFFNKILNPSEPAKEASPETNAPAQATKQAQN